MSKFIPTKKNNPCPVCDDISGDCRINGDLVLCHSFPDGIETPDYRFTKPANGGIWGVYAPAQNDWTPEQKDEYKTAQQRKKQARLTKESELHRNGLTRAERDHNIRAIAAYVGLNSKHHQQLVDRGLTPEQIKAGLYFSICPYQPVPLATSDKLAGVGFSRDGKKVLVSSKSGFACVIFDDEGQAVGWQLRDENPEAENKYLWAVTHLDKDNRISSHLQNGELPLTVRGDGSTVWLTEGILKPDIASCKFGLKVIGAAGGQFLSSKAQLVKYSGDAERIIIAPDAGDAINPDVYRRWCKVIKYQVKSGRDVAIAWWGQITKDSPDIDELESLDDVQYLAPKEWHRLAAKVQKNQNTEAAKAIARFDITPHLVISNDEKYLPDGIIPTDKKIVGLKAPKNCGKSVQQGKHIDLIRSMGLIPVQLTHRRNLSSEKANEWGLTYIDSDAPVPSHFPENGVSLVADSCLKLKQIPNIPYERLVIFKDESEQVLSHITDSDTAIKRNRAAVMDFIGELLSRCHQVILADADLKTISIEWAKSLCGCGDRDVFIIEKKYKHNRDAVIFDDTPDLVVQLTQHLRAGDNCYTALSGQKVDSVLGSQTLETYFNGIAKSQIRVDSDTNKDPSHPAYRIAKNLGVLNEHQHTLATNTVGTGISITGNHFDGVYAIATGSNPVESFLQQPERVRNDATRYIAVSSVANGQSQKYGGVISVSELMLITGKHGDAIRSHLKDFGDFGDDWLFNPWVKAWAERTCLNNHLGKDYLGSLVALMEADGYRIERRSLCTKEQRKEIRTLLKGNAIEKTQQYISDILSSNALLGKALEASKSANDKTYPERCAEEHGDILTLYGDDSEAIATAHITEHGFYKKLQLHFWLGQSTESVRERDKRKLHYLKKDSHGKLFPNDIRKICITPKVTAIKKYHFDEVLTRGYIYSGCPILNEFMGILQDEIKRTEASLELGLGLDSCPKKSIGSMGKWLLDNLFGLKIGDRKKHQGIWVHFIESGDIPRDAIFGFWEQNMLTDEIEQPDFAPEPEPMATAIAPESVPEKPTENRTDFEQLIFSIGKSVLASETFTSRNSQTTEHFFENTGLSFSPAENQPILGQNFTPPSAPIATAIAPIITTPEPEPVAIAATPKYRQGDRLWWWSICGRKWLEAQVIKAGQRLEEMVIRLIANDHDVYLDGGDRIAPV